MGQANPLHLVAGVLLLILVGRSSLHSYLYPTNGNTSSGPQSDSIVKQTFNGTEFGSNSLIYNLYTQLSDDKTDSGDNSTCAYAIASQYKCSEENCEDLVAGYINYISFQECTITNSAARFGSGVLLIIWLLFLLHIVESTTNEYFVTSLQLAVAILNLSPNVAGVTFLAVGNAACDVIASVAAFATGVPKVGVGTTLGAGIFVTTACVAAVSFVADVRLARRSFIRDVLFFIITIVYLLFCTLDGIITVGESWGFIIIYFVFLGVVVGGRCLRFLRTEDEHSSVAGVIHNEAKTTSSASTEEGSYQGPNAVQQTPGFTERKNNILSALESARREAMQRQHDKEIQSLKNQKYFANSNNDNDEEDGDGDLGTGSGDVGFTSNLADEDSLLPPTSRSGNRANTGTISTMVDDIPNKPSKWTSAFYSTQQEESSGGQYMPFQMPKYHRKKLAKKLAKRLAARGIHHEVITADGRTVDIAELALTDPDAAANMIASAAAAVTAEAVKYEGAPLSFQAAAQAAAHGAVLLSGHDAPGHLPGETSLSSSHSAVGISSSSNAAAIPVEDLLAVMPKETIKPVSVMYVRFKRVMNVIGPYYHKFMHTAELPVIVARHLTIPLLHEGSYHRRLALLNLPCSFALFTVVMTTHILKGTATSVGGFPLAALAAIVGACFSAVLHFKYLPNKAINSRKEETVGLLGATATPVPDGSSTPSENKNSNHHHEHHWYDSIVSAVIGPVDDPMPKGVIFTCYLLLSFVMSLIWLLLIANELVGTALCFGKVLNVPDIVMGLVVLAVGNSINDLAASVTIAREGFPSMAVAGAYAGPMFNVLAGIGLPMLIYTIRAEDQQYPIGKDTPIVWAAFITLLTSLTVTLIWVPLAGFRITHKIGRFLLFWFFMFIVLVIIMGSIPSIAGENDVVLGG